MVEKISPTTDGLPQRKGRRREIQQGGKRKALCAGIDEPRQQAADDSAIDGQTALAQIEDGKRMGRVLFPGDGHVIQARPKDGAGNANHRNVQGGVWGKPEAFFSSGCETYSQQNAQGDEHAVPFDGKAQNIKSLRMEFQEKITSFTVIIIILARNCQDIRIATSQKKGYNKE